jgi:hypothetical protein
VYHHLAFGVPNVLLGGRFFGIKQTSLAAGSFLFLPDFIYRKNWEKGIPKIFLPFFHDDLRDF